MRKIKLITLAFSMFTSAVLFAGNEHLPVGARSAGVAHSSVTFADQWSVFQNQAGLGRLKEISAGVYYENRFMVNSFSTGAIAAAIPTNSGTFGVSVYTFGFTNYRESKVGLAYGRQLGEKITAGLQLNYLSTVLPESYGRFNGFTAELGLQALLTDKLILGAHLYNVSRAKLTDKDNLEYVPSILRIGLLYKISEKVLVSTEFQKDIDHPIIFKTGTEYSPNDKLFLRIGISSNPGNYSFGFGYHMKTISFDIAASYHQILGFTPQIGFNWNLSGADIKPTFW